MKILSPKASFDEYYTLYYPKRYVPALLKEKNYYLPFYAMELLGTYLRQMNSPKILETVFLGSGHGLEVTALK
ncbi:MULTISPECIES: hypothetical protein [Moorena]|uniref:Uncharacterized protein n=1 Tax=Moorena producens 3L TaxID=489825 RepID=F4XXJ9_9CYAN|nr:MULTISPECIES: hypothetical protein [Moorena]NES86437.1 hypothetical protein [Moorena sp. SIO2B7]EGJ30677.1 hypothetical protein LYNGBM3L_47610 [Moorena producens 3L]NEP35369.1 hypothetical protein [Moorena sp. SIO3B2]NEP64615.1 hypothetical protein [Moorena sp. SIO3A5]NER87716.1 hypothetical protein [Moorena sp. SIO3A2]